MLKQVHPRGSANVLWAMAVLLEATPRMASLLPVLISILASAHLKDAAADVLKVVCQHSLPTFRARPVK